MTMTLRKIAEALDDARDEAADTWVAHTSALDTLNRLRAQLDNWNDGEQEDNE